LELKGEGGRMRRKRFGDERKANARQYQRPERELSPISARTERKKIRRRSGRTHILGKGGFQERDQKKKIATLSTALKVLLKKSIASSYRFASEREKKLRKIIAARKEGTAGALDTGDGLQIRE